MMPPRTPQQRAVQQLRSAMPGALGGRVRSAQQVRPRPALVRGVGAATVTAPTDLVPLADTFDRANTSAGTLGTTSDGQATWTVHGGQLRIDSNRVVGGVAASAGTIDVLTTAPVLVSGRLVRHTSVVSGGRVSLVSHWSGSLGSSESYYELRRDTGFADYFTLRAWDYTQGGHLIETFFNLGFADQLVGLRVTGTSVEVFVGGALHGTYTNGGTVLPPATGVHGVFTENAGAAYVEDFSVT